MAQSSTSLMGSVQQKQKQKIGMNMKEYEEEIGRLVSKEGVRGIAVTSGDGKLVYHNNGLPEDILNTYIEVISNIEYLCTVAARENDPTNQWQYIRFETDEYEMIVTIDPTHLIFLLADPQRPQEAHIGNGDDKGEEALNNSTAL